MGGKALKHSNIRRVTAAEHRAIGQEVLAALSRNFPGHRAEVLPHYAEKATFGNLSIFVESDTHQMDQSMARDLGALFGSPEFVRNDNRVSVAVRELQVDISIYPTVKFQTALDYHSYNTLGGLIGRLAHQVGLVLRDGALEYDFIIGTHKLADITVTSTWKDSLTLLGLDHTRWSQGFKSLTEMFAYVVSSTLFSRTLFRDWDVIGYTDIPDDMPLTVLQSFGMWLDKTDPSQIPADAVVSKEAWLEALFAARPALQAQRDAALKRRADQAAAHEKLNGNLVIEWTGRQKAELGKLLQALKDAFGSVDALTQWVLSASESDIKSKVMSLHASI
jgi:hypothetical protein